MKKLAAILIISCLFTSACSKQITNDNSYQEEVYSLTCNNKVIYENAKSITLIKFHWQIIDHNILYSYTPISGELCARTKHTIKGK